MTSNRGRGRPRLDANKNIPADLAKIARIARKAAPQAMQLMVDSMVIKQEDGTLVPNVKIAEKVVAIWAQVFKMEADLQKGDKDATPVAGGEARASFQMTVVNPTNNSQVSVKTA